MEDPKCAFNCRVVGLLLVCRQSRSLALHTIGCLLRWPLEVGLQRFPTLSVVVLLDLLALRQAPLSDANHKTALKHERHASLAYLHWLQVGVGSFLMSRGVRPVGRHDVMQRSASRLEATAGFGVVLAVNQAHKLGHGVSVIPWWTECVLSDQPAYVSVKFRRREVKSYHLGGKMTKSATAVPG